MDNYIKEIENSVITDLNLKEYYHLPTDDNTKKLEIICDLNKLSVKELALIVETAEMSKITKCLHFSEGC